MLLLTKWLINIDDNDVLGKTHIPRLECSIKIEEIEDQSGSLIQFDLL